MLSVSRSSCAVRQSASYPAGAEGAEGAEGAGRRVSGGERVSTRGAGPGWDFLCPPALEELLRRVWRSLQDGLPVRDDLNQLLEFQSDELRWTAQKRGLWSLEYRRELTTPLCVAAAAGCGGCVAFLLQHGARAPLVAGGRAALHQASGSSSEECVSLLLQHGADPNQSTDTGLTPLHLCTHAASLRCAKLLVRHGAQVNALSADEAAESPLHTAARHGLAQHVQLYLRYGAQVHQRSGSGETALGAACGVERFNSGDEEEDRCVQVCVLLLDYGADVNQVDEEHRTPLHKAARNAQHRLVELLLERGALVNVLDYNGCSPLSNALQNAAVRQRCRPHATVRTLLNHGSMKVWPGALLKVLVVCALAPKTVEIMFNSYDIMPVTYKWRAAIPEEAQQMHQAFYGSLFSLENTPRSLQHLCRSVLRRHCTHTCHRVLPLLPLPHTLTEYLLLQPQGYVH